MAQHVPGRTKATRTGRRTLQIVGYALPVGWVGVLLFAYPVLTPWYRLAGATLGLFFTVKVGAWLIYRARHEESVSLTISQGIVYWTIWPGVRPDSFANTETGTAEPDGRTFVIGYLFVGIGIGLLLGAILAYPVLGRQVSTWLALFAFLAIIHAGVGRILPFVLRWLGFSVPPLFDNPLRSQSVGAFWSRRWNRPFVEMNRLFVTKPLQPKTGIAIAAAVGFVVSGILHELAISYPAGAGWGLPMVYFLIQAIAYTIEQRVFPDEGDGWSLPRMAWTYAIIFLPLPLLFHDPFRMTFLLPVIETGHALIHSYSLSAYLAAGLWLAGAGHFLVLVASSRVPDELNWHEDLQSLEPLNRKLLWTYGGFIVLVIVSFGVLTFAFHGELLAGNPVALGVAGMIAVFWTARILVDFLYFSHDDWPSGVEFVVGHALLTSLFVFLVLVYSATIVFHLA